jgi:hypothetical protein
MYEVLRMERPSFHLSLCASIDRALGTVARVMAFHPQEVSKLGENGSHVQSRHPLQENSPGR